MRRLSHLLARAVGAVLAVLLAALVLIATAETVAWTLFDVSWAAAPEIEGILLIWFGLLGAAWGVHERIHLGVDALTGRLPRRVRELLGRLASALVALFGGLLVYYGVELAGRVSNTLPATGLQASMQYFPAAVGGALIAWFALDELIAGAPEPESR